LCVSYLRKTIDNYFEDDEKFGIKIECVISNKDLSTAGQLKTAEKFIGDTFVCMEILFLILILKI
jgi:mannose-1-phosphate guanylyltransferase